MLTQEILHDEALKRFAALTRHKDSPESLMPPFSTAHRPGDDETTMELGFGKRRHEFKFFTSYLELSAQEFGTKHLDDAARALLDSKG